MRTALAAGFLSLAAFPVAGEISLGLPLDCELGPECYIQQYADRDPGPGVLDYRCGDLSYDGHTGTDFALPSLAAMRAGVRVLATAPGVVAAVRDGVADTGPGDATAGKECGNGVVVRHADGWETQYCHLKSGSVRVARGAQVARGTVLGEVGLSGKTQFPHVELSVRRDGETVDPFATAAMPSCGTGGDGLWQDAPAYAPGGLIGAGFSPGLPEYAAIKDGGAGHDRLDATAGGLVLFAYAYGGRTGDIVEIRIAGPDGAFMNRDVRLEKDQAQFFRAAGKRLRAARWPAGTYRGTVRLRRGDRVLGERRVQTVID